MSLPEVLAVVKSMAKFHAAGRAFLARNKTQVPILKQRNYHERFSCHFNFSFELEIKLLLMYYGIEPLGR